MGKMKKLRHHLIPRTNRLEETALTERLDKTEDDQSVSLPNYGLWSQCRQWGGGGHLLCTCASWLSLPKSVPESIILGLLAPGSQQGKGVVRRTHSRDCLVGLGLLGTATCGSSGVALNTVRLKTELSCLLGVSRTAVEASHRGDWSSCQGTARTATPEVSPRATERPVRVRVLSLG